MNEHANLKKLFWVLLVSVLIIFVALFLVQKNQSKGTIESMVLPTEETATQSTEPNEVESTESATEQEARMKAEYEVYAKANPTYFVQAELFSTLESKLEAEIEEDLRYPISGKQIVEIIPEKTVFTKAICTKPNDDPMTVESCTTETIALADLKKGDIIMISLDEEIFKTDGNLVANSIMLK